MCGIAGFCNLEHNQERNIEKMNQRMYMRGPDAGGFWISEDRCVTFGHRRLSVIDLSKTGAQPMKSAKGNFVCVFNGEVYNHLSIRKKLIAEGKVKSFRGTSDTETLLEAFESYGIEKTIAMCKGMFAIAVYEKGGKISLIRDRVGEKPLYYGFVNDVFVFASDIGSISEIDGFNNKIDRKVLPIYFRHGYIPTPYSIYENIYKLEPGCILEVKPPYKDIQNTRYWSMDKAAEEGQNNMFKGSEAEAEEELERLLRLSIREQMIADVPVGAFLSAGIDSSTVVSLMQSENRGRVKTFTIGMDEKDYDEAVYARNIAKHLGTDHTEIYISEKEAKNVIPKLNNIFSEPFADSSQIPTYLVSSIARQHVTVALSGDGGDELFGGYNSYLSAKKNWNKIRKYPYFVRKIGSSLLKRMYTEENKRMQSRAVLLEAKSALDFYKLSSNTDKLSGQIVRNNSVHLYQYDKEEYNSIDEDISRLMLLDMNMYHLDDILVKVDRTAMSVSLETRVPMLDKDVVEFAWSVPMEYKIQNNIGKSILRNVLYKYVPKEMFDRPKHGFSIPLTKWLRDKRLREWAECLIDRELIRKQGYLNEDVIWKIWEDFIDKGIWRVQIWYILMFQNWLMENSHI